jgi:uncharacterized protein YjbJ (UPF0337 family)
VERHVGEWTGDTEKQAHGAAKQVEGKVQNAWGNAKDAARSVANEANKPKDVEDADDTQANDVPRSEKKAS